MIRVVFYIDLRLCYIKQMKGETQMQKMMLDMLQIAIVVKMGYSLIRWVFSGTKKRKSIAGKVMNLATRKIHFYLDNALRNQKEKYSPIKKGGNVIPLKRSK